MNVTQDAGLIAAKTRLTEAKARKAEIELAVLEGQKVDRAEVNRRWGEQAGRVKTKILALPSRMAPQFVSLGVDAERVNEIMSEVITEILTELAEEYE